MGENNSAISFTQTDGRTLFTETFPAFAVEVRQLLTERGESELAARVPNLAILVRCCCGDHICGTFYTKPTPKGGFGRVRFPDAE